MPIPSLIGKWYYISFIDDFTRKVWVTFLKTKDEAFSIFQAFKALTEKESGYKIKCLRTDNDEEYTSNEFENFLRRHGIKHQTTIICTPAIEWSR